MCGVQRRVHWIVPCEAQLLTLPHSSTRFPIHRRVYWIMPCKAQLLKHGSPFTHGPYTGPASKAVACKGGCDTNTEREWAEVGCSCRRAARCSRHRRAQHEATAGHGRGPMQLCPHCDEHTGVCKSMWMWCACLDQSRLVQSRMCLWIWLCTCACKHRGINRYFAPGRRRETETLSSCSQYSNQLQCGYPDDRQLARSAEVIL